MAISSSYMKSGRTFGEKIYNSNMPLGNAPAMFVSSTCYDLKQIRSDLKEFLESLGITPILSEFDTFPVNPDEAAVENCFRVVDENADLFLLVVGGRYGSIQKGGKSVTNMEYIRARAKGIPIYVFVDKGILANVPIWKENHTMEFKSVVDSPKLFEFVSTLQDSEGVWVYSFERVNDIVQTLRTQLGYLFMNALETRRRFKESHLPESLSNLKGKSLKLLIEKPDGWEYALFANHFIDEIDANRGDGLDLKYNIVFGRSDQINDLTDLMRWTSFKLNEATRIVSALEKLISDVLNEALGPSGVSGDAELLVYTAKKLALAHKVALDWTMEARRVNVRNDLFMELVRIAGTFLDSAIESIESFSTTMMEFSSQITSHLNRGSDESLEINHTVSIQLANVDAYNEEFDRVREALGLGSDSYDEKIY